MPAKIHPRQIGFDFDGVIADTAEAFLRLACEQHALCDIALDQITHFQIEECVDMDVQVVEDIFTQILEDSVETGLKPMEDAIAVLEAFSALAPVHIITARPLAAPVQRWMQLHMPRQLLDKVNLVAMGDHDDKARHVQQLNLSHFIDDRAETCKQLEQAGIRSIVFSQPWNRYQTRLPKVENWQQIKQLCL
ncbi:MAG: hypothetical protein CSB34_07130 [Desulfobulbus propionicus]|nr:MAG: hypothetical protein CSB34_07130 [Desulfobulbus propionicus]